MSPRPSAHGAKRTIAELGGGPNGAAIGPDGRCRVCNNGGFRWHERDGTLLPGLPSDDYRGGWIEAVDLDSGRSEVLYRECDGAGLKGSNDLVLDTQGGMWLTDHGKTHQRSRDRGAVYYATTDDNAIREVIFPLDSPNGIALSPGGDVLYVTETHTARLWAFDIVGPGQIARTRGGMFEIGRLVTGLGGYRLFDSMAVEATGNICVATIPDGISVISPDGALVDVVPMDEPFATNICFAGPALSVAYITLSSTGRLAKMPWQRPGLALNY